MSGHKKIKVIAPASTSNLGPGFDTLGLALELYNTFTFSFDTESTGVKVTFEGEGANELESGSDNRTIRSLESVLNSYRVAIPAVHLHQKNDIPLARGLGGSATSVLAGVIAGLLYMGKQPEVTEILAQSGKIENHPDNLTPSLVGGMTVSIMDSNGILFVQVALPDDLRCVVYLPDVSMPTGQARQVIPRQVSLGDAVFNIQHASLLVAALASGQVDKIARAMQDRLHQPYRTVLLPGMDDIFAAALSAGALGTALSGAGSGIFAFVSENAEHVAGAMERMGHACGLGGSARVLAIEQSGTRWAELD